MEYGTLPTSAVDPPSSVERHFPIRHSNRPDAHRSRNYIFRAAAKRYANAPGPYLCQDLGLTCSAKCTRCGDSNPVTRRIRLEKDLRAEAPITIRYRSPRTRTRWSGDDKSEGCDLARSAVPLPSDRFRLTRTPSLEREDAFRDAATAKGNVRLRRSPPVSEEAQIAELYRMGLLYDNEHDRGEAFSLNSIEHQEPVYTVRPAKRSRKNRARRYTDLDKPLHLDLSFTDLGVDHTIAQFFPSGSSESEPSDDGSVEQTTREFAPLRVIYELDGSQPDIDVDTSQPPDLISDLLSDYDCFSDSELDDLPSQREVRDSAATPSSEAWIVLG